MITTRLQSDPVEKRFSQSRQMSDSRFLDNLREVLNSERILRCRSIIKKYINFKEEDITYENLERFTVMRTFLVLEHRNSWEVF